eukprot:COSAG02_NODE_9139_length_2315_cov_2.050542_2_plen_108_part_00
MLEVGNFKGPNNLTESRTHFGGWCIVSAPLILGMDLTDASNLDAVWPIISNVEAVCCLRRQSTHTLGTSALAFVYSSSRGFSLFCNRGGACSMRLHMRPCPWLRTCI